MPLWAARTLAFHNEIASPSTRWSSSTELAGPSCASSGETEDELDEAATCNAGVVQALARFEEVGPMLNNPPSLECFLTLVSAMRGNAGAVSLDDLQLVLAGQRLPDQSAPVALHGPQ